MYLSMSHLPNLDHRHPPTTAPPGSRTGTRRPPHRASTTVAIRRRPGHPAPDTSSACLQRATPATPHSPLRTLTSFRSRDDSIRSTSRDDRSESWSRNTEEGRPTARARMLVAAKGLRASWASGTDRLRRSISSPPPPSSIFDAFPAHFRRHSFDSDAEARSHTRAERSGTSSSDGRGGMGAGAKTRLLTQKCHRNGVRGER